MPTSLDRLFKEYVLNILRNDVLTLVILRENAEEELYEFDLKVLYANLLLLHNTEFYFIYVAYEW